MKLKVLAAAAVLSLGAASSFAVDVPITLTGGSGGFSATRSGAFSDNFYFQITTPSTLSSIVSSINLGGLQDVSFTTVTLTAGTVSGTTYTPAATGNPIATFTNAQSGQIELRTLLSTPTLNAGVYAVSVAGTVNSNSGTYTGSVNVSPIPEPETYALMLAGLACVGFVARRRNAG